MQSVAAHTRLKEPPLCVDLDGTLVKSDLLLETLVLLLSRKPLAFFFLPGWLLSGRANLKRQIAQRVQAEMKHLPYRDDLLEFLRSEKVKGRCIMLVSAADELLAQQVENHLQLFDEVLGSTGTRSSSFSGRDMRDTLAL